MRSYSKHVMSTLTSGQRSSFLKISWMWSLENFEIHIIGGDWETGAHSIIIPVMFLRGLLKVSLRCLVAVLQGAFFHLEMLSCTLNHYLVIIFGSFDCRDLEKQFSEARNCVCAGTEFRLGTLTPQQLKREKKPQLCPLTALNSFDSQAHNVVGLAACYSPQPSILLLKLWVIDEPPAQPNFRERFYLFFKSFSCKKWQMLTHRGNWTPNKWWSGFQAAGPAAETNCDAVNSPFHATFWLCCLLCICRVLATLYQCWGFGSNF